MNISKIVFGLAVIACALPFVDAPFALLMGIVVAQTVRNPFLHINKKLTHILLQASVVGLGFGMNVTQALQAGKQGLWFTIFSIASTLMLGLFIGRRLKVENNTSYLISTGTAVCGGSAIAAISTVLKANEKQISTALGTVFILNSLALFLFPWIGRRLGMSEHQFGVWAAIAIHDTSSVVGAAARFGQEALQTATTIKLERALWIIPLSFMAVFAFKSEARKITIPWFILLFVLAMMINSYFPAFHPVSVAISNGAKIGLKITLFLIGTGLTRELITSAGPKPLVQGVLLWTFISVLSLVVVVSTIA